MFSIVALFNRFILRDVCKNAVRSILTVSGIALGVAVLLAISLANHTALAKFGETVDLVAGKANLEIRPLTAPSIDERLLYQLQWLWRTGTKYTAIIDANVLLGSDEKNGTLAQLIGIDMLGDPEFKSYEESGASASKSARDLDVLQPGAAILGARLAHERNLRVGDSFQVLSNEKVQELKVLRILSSQGLGGAFSGNLVVVDLSTAQKVCGMEGKISRVELIAPKSELQPVQQKLAETVDRALVVGNPGGRTAQVEKMTRSFEYNLLALTFIALIVGMFLIYNTMTISVIRRRSEIGTLRALGLSRSGILTLFCLEAFCFGLVGTALGIVGGIGGAQSALNAVSQTFAHFYFVEPLESISLDPLIIVGAFCGGVFLTVLAAAMPAFEAAAISPAEAARRASFEVRINRTISGATLLGLASFLVAGICAYQPAFRGFPVFGYAAAFFTILGSSFMFPVFLKTTLPSIAALFGRLGMPEGRLAARSLQGTLGRTSIALASLSIGIAMMISLAIMIGSFRKTVMVWVDQTLKADLWVQTAARYGGSRDARIAPGTVDLIRHAPGVLAVDGFVEHQIEYRGNVTHLGAGDLDVVGKYGHLLFTDGKSSSEVCSHMGDHDAIVSETFAVHSGVRSGDKLQIDLPAQTVTFTVKDIYYDYASDLGYIIIPMPSYRRLFADQTYSNCAVYIEPGADSEAVRAEIAKRVGSASRLRIRTMRELRTEALKVFDRTFAITYALHTIAIAVAVLSVMNALFALTMEFKRDFAILRYLGATDSQLRRVILVEAGILGCIGELGGLLLGFTLSMLLIFVINKQSFGWTVQVSIPVEFLLQSGVLVFLTALLAGLIPAKFATVTAAPSAVRDE